MKEFDINAFDFNYLLLEYAKDLKINEEELAVILMVDHLLKQEPYSLITPDILVLKLSLSLERIDVILTSLNHRSLISQVKSGKTMYTTLMPLHLLLRDRAVNAIINVDQVGADKALNEALENTYSIFERELGRPLSSTELNQIFNWLKKYGKDEILDALNETKDTKKVRVTIKNVDKTLFDRAVKKDRKSEGRSTLSAENEMSLKEAAEAAKLDWLNED